MKETPIFSKPNISNLVKTLNKLSLISDAEKKYREEGKSARW